MGAIYLDNAATTPLDPLVRGVLEGALTEHWANPSSRHAPGVAARKAIEQARRALAHTLGATEATIVFTASGTEANNLAILGRAANLPRGGRVLLGPDEHPSVGRTGPALERQGFIVESLPRDPSGELDLSAARDLLTPDVVLVSCMLVNNELGRVHPVRELARLVRSLAPQAHLHTDAVQAMGKVPLDWRDLEVDSLALSGHKFHGGKGTGALVLRREDSCAPYLFGGGQESGLRPGTENTPLILAFERAAALAQGEQAAFHARALEWTSGLVAGLPEGIMAHLPRRRCPAILALSVPGPPAEVWQHHLEARGILVGVGSACSSKDKSVSPARAAIGASPKEARQVMRISLARTTTRPDILRASAAIREVHATLASLRP